MPPPVRPPDPNATVGEADYYWTTPAAPSVQNRGTDKKPPANAIFWTIHTYADGRKEVWQHDPKAGAGQEAWIKRNTIQPKPDDVNAQRFKNQQDEYDKYAAKAAPQVTQTADPTEEFITVQRINPDTGQLEFIKEKNPSYDKAAADLKQQSIQAQTGTYEAASTKSKIEAERATREEAERGTARPELGGTTGLTNVEATDRILAQGKEAWQRSQDQIKNDLDTRKIGFDEAVSRLNAEHARINQQIEADRNRLTQRGQDITLRGQNLDTATEMGRMQVAMMPYQSDPAQAANLGEAFRAMGTPGYKPNYQTPQGIKAQDPLEITRQALAGLSSFGNGAVDQGYQAPMPGQVNLTSPNPQAPMPTYGPSALPPGAQDMSAFIAPQRLMPGGTPLAQQPELGMV
jgi:Tfp pilus assembly protein PilX